MPGRIIGNARFWTILGAVKKCLAITREEFEIIVIYKVLVIQFVLQLLS